MSTVLSTQVTGIYIRKCIEDSSKNYQKTLEQLSSGSKFTTIGDNPMGMSKTTEVEVEINFNSQLQTNIALGSDMISITEGYEEDVLSNIERIRDLVSQVANQTYSAEDKNYILNEIRSRLSYINSTSDNTNFNGTNLLDGSVPDLSIKVGPSTADTINIGSLLIDCHTDALDIDIDDTITGDTWTQDDIAAYLTNIDDAINTIINNVAKLGAKSNQLDNIYNIFTTKITNLTEYKSNISDCDTAEVASDMVKYQILQEYSTAIFVQTNEMSNLSYSLLTVASR